MPQTELTGLSRKKFYAENFMEVFKQYKKFMLVSLDNVRSQQVQAVRKALYGKAEIRVIKNTILRQSLRTFFEETEQAGIDKLITALHGNVAFLFTDQNLREIRSIIVENSLAAPARAGAISPINFTLPAIATSLAPEETSFFQDLGIETTIQKGTISIKYAVPLLSVGSKVTPSQADLLKKLDIKPFSYTMEPLFVCENGKTYDAKALSISNEELIGKFKVGVSNVAALSLATGIPNKVSYPHMILRGFKRLAAIAITTDYVFDQAKTLKEMIENPDAFAAAVPTTEEKSAQEKEEEEEESEEESDDDLAGAFDMF